MKSSKQNEGHSMNTGVPTVLYVSPEGNDANTGLGPQPQQALRTIQVGVDRLKPDDTLLIRGGVYRETVTFQRSGQAGKPITLKPYQNEEPVVTGCDPLDGWVLEDERKGIWKASMPWTLGLGRNQVFDGGDVMIEARYPNTPAPGLGMYVSNLSPLWPTFGLFSIPEETRKEQPGRVVSKLLEGQPADYWKGAIYYGVHLEGWGAQTGVVESSKSGELSVEGRTRTWWFGTDYGWGIGYYPEEGRGMIVGHINALDQPGQWHWQDKTLHLIPRSGQAPTGIEAKHRQLAFDLSGQQHIHITGMKVQAASVRMLDCAFCTFDRCDLSYISHYTLHDGAGQIEHGRDTISSGETGIIVGGHDNAFLNCSVRVSAGAGIYLRGYHHTIHNCLIDEVAYTGHYTYAIQHVGNNRPNHEGVLGGGHVITHNTLRNAGRSFWSFGEQSSKTSRTRSCMGYMASLLAHNHLYNGMLQTRDAGFLTAYYTDAGTLNGLKSQVVCNVMHDCYDIFAMRTHMLGITYLDAATYNVDLHDNLLWAAPGSLQQGLWYNTMCVGIRERDNLFHPEFTRTCAELKPADFPRAQPFRFGHDFVHPPEQPQWPQLVQKRYEAADFSNHSPGVQISAAGLSGLRDGDWFALEGVDFDQGWQSAVLHFASDQPDLNTDHSARQAPRHTKATDPLVLESTCADSRQGADEQWTFIRKVSDGAWLRFNQVPLGEGYRRFRVVYGSVKSAPRKLELRLDRVDGQKVGEVTLAQTDQDRGRHIQVYAEAVGAIDPAATGTHDLFLVFHSPDGNAVGEFEYFRLEQYRGAIPLQTSEVKLELRLGSTEGEKIGECYPLGTGGALNFCDLVTSLEPAKGKQPLIVVVRSAHPGPIGTLDWISLEKARQPIDWTGVGVPPMLDQGQMVLPQPTHRPCARPADRYNVRQCLPQTVRSAKLPQGEVCVIRLGAQWKFKPDPGEVGDRDAWYARTCDDAQWAVVRTDLYCGWEKQGFPLHVGFGWHRQSFNLPKECARKHIYLHFGAIDKEGWIHINGDATPAFEHSRKTTGLSFDGLWNRPFMFDASGMLKPGERNLLAVKVHSHQYQCGIWLPVHIVASDAELTLEEVDEALF